MKTLLISTILAVCACSDRHDTTTSVFTFELITVTGIAQEKRLHMHTHTLHSLHLVYMCNSAYWGDCYCQTFEIHIRDEWFHTGGGLAYWQRVGLDQRSYSTSGPVNTWMGDYLQTNHLGIYLGQLSFHPSGVNK